MVGFNVLQSLQSLQTTKGKGVEIAPVKFPVYAANLTVGTEPITKNRDILYDTRVVGVLAFSDVVVF